MTSILKIDRAFYEVNDTLKTYRYHGRNLDWKKLSRQENMANKKHIDGYARIFPNGKKKIYNFGER